jgi:glycosyltransferase involved in cell wall biosynthesis
MDINFTLWSTNMSGGYKVIFELSNGLIDRGHNVTITALGGNHSWFPLKARVNYVKPPWLIRLLNPLLKLILKRPARYYEILTLTQKLKMGFEPDLIKALAENTPECDVNISTWFPTAFSVHRSDKGVPVYLCQDFEELAQERGHYMTQMFYESLYLPLDIITISGWLRDWIKENYGKDPILMNVGIDHDVFYPRENVLKGTKGHKIMAIFRGLTYKGDYDLIEALNIVSKTIPDISLIAIGKQDVLKKIFGESEVENKINFSYQEFSEVRDDKMAQLYSSADLFAFPSHIEGFGLPPLEAMACNTPVVTADCLGVRDYILDGKNAFLVPPKDPEALSNAIINVLTSNEIQEKFETNGLATAKEFTWERAIDVFEKALIQSVEKIDSK